MRGALLLLLAAAAPLRAQCGARRWAVKTLSDSTAPYVMATPTPTSVAALTRLPRPASIPATTRTPAEYRTYQVQAELVGWAAEADGDYHLVLRDPVDTTRTMIAEAPDPRCSGAELRVRQELEAVRGVIRDVCRRSARPLGEHRAAALAGRHGRRLLGLRAWGQRGRRKRDRVAPDHPHRGAAMSVPAGAIGFSAPPRGGRGLLSRLIAWRQALFGRDRLIPGSSSFATSHVRLSLGEAGIIEQTWPHWRTRTQAQDAADNPGLIWYAPAEPYTPDQTTALVAAARALAQAGGHYSAWALIRFLVVGTLGKGGWVCTSGAALLTWIATGTDVSGCGQPDNVEIRTWITYVQAASWRRLT